MKTTIKDIFNEKIFQGLFEVETMIDDMIYDVAQHSAPVVNRTIEILSTIKAICMLYVENNYIIKSEEDYDRLCKQMDYYMDLDEDMLPEQRADLELIALIVEKYEKKI